MSRLSQIKLWVGEYYYRLINDRAIENEMSTTRMVLTIIDNAYTFLGEDAFKLDLDVGEFEEFGHPDEGNRILNYMTNLVKPLGLDSLLLARFDMNIPDRDIFLKAFYDLLQLGLIKEEKPTWNKYQKKFKDYKVYDVVDKIPTKRKVLNKDARREQYEKLRKEFEGED